MDDKHEVEAIQDYYNQLKINNKLLVIIGKILLESNQGQIEDKDWHKWDDQIKELKKEI